MSNPEYFNLFDSSSWGNDAEKARARARVWKRLAKELREVVKIQDETIRLAAKALGDDWSDK